MLFERLKLVSALLMLAVLGCAESPTSTQLPAPPKSLMKHASIGSVVADPVMGKLSAVARQVVVGLGDAEVRRMVVLAMKSPAAAGAGLDLSTCEQGAITAKLMTAAELRGAREVEGLCSVTSGSRGLTLFMSQDGLRRWDGSFVPIVTAIENPRGQLPKQWKGYRSGQRTIDLFANQPTPGPVLVVSTIVHPAQLARSSRTIPTQSVHVGPLAPGITPRSVRPAPSPAGGK